LVSGKSFFVFALAQVCLDQQNSTQVSDQSFADRPPVVLWGRPISADVNIQFRAATRRGTALLVLVNRGC
jgi:hypothetical protein